MSISRWGVIYLQKLRQAFPLADLGARALKRVCDEDRMSSRTDCCFVGSAFAIMQGSGSWRNGGK
jgi:hypothetical protein